MARIYCAGPLFNQAEQNEMSSIAEVLEQNGYTTFLPHRDGIEGAKVLPELEKLDPQNAEAILGKCIFALDVYELLQSDGVVVNLNGRVPDEGAIVEAAIAWYSSKPLVLYKSDARCFMKGFSVNPMVAGLNFFETVHSLEEIPQAIAHELTQNARYAAGGWRLRIEDMGEHVRDTLSQNNQSPGDSVAVKLFSIWKG